MIENTKQNIIESAINLFNSHGYENVSMRDISSALHISPGNLTYHYNKKADLLQAISKQMKKEHEDMQYKPEITLSQFHDILLEVTKHQQKYAFYYRNMIELQHKYSWIAKEQADYKAEFIDLLERILQHFIRSGWLQKECYPNIYRNLALAMISIIAFWAQFHTEKEMTDVVFSVLLPNLTEDGKRECADIF